MGITTAIVAAAGGAALKLKNDHERRKRERKIREEKERNEKLMLEPNGKEILWKK